MLCQEGLCIPLRAGALGIRRCCCAAPTSRDAFCVNGGGGGATSAGAAARAAATTLAQAALRSTTRRALRRRDGGRGAAANTILLWARAFARQACHRHGAKVCAAMTTWRFSSAPLGSARQRRTVGGGAGWRHGASCQEPRFFISLRGVRRQGGAGWKAQASGRRAVAMHLTQIATDAASLRHSGYACRTALLPSPCAGVITAARMRRAARGGSAGIALAATRDPGAGAYIGCISSALPHTALSLHLSTSKAG